MAKLNESYEAMIVFSMGQGEDGIKALIEKFKGLIEQNAELTDFEDWGKRKLAYPINDKPEGYYVLVTFKSEGAFPSELERIFGISEGIMRSIVIRREETKAPKEKKAAEPKAEEN